VKKRLFVNHISEERKTAERFKTALNRDFLGMIEVLSRLTPKAERQEKSGFVSCGVRRSLEDVGMRRI
jgi:hypothetical protein